MELSFEELEASASEDDLAAQAAASGTKVEGFGRHRPGRRSLPEHLPRERVLIAAPASCPAAGRPTVEARRGRHWTLEVIPRQWKVLETVRERFACRDCETITQPPAPFHVVPRGWAGPGFLAMLLFEKYSQHQPLNCQAERFARQGVPLSLPTLADQVGACRGAAPAAPPDRGACACLAAVEHDGRGVLHRGSRGRFGALRQAGDLQHRLGSLDSWDSQAG